MAAVLGQASVEIEGELMTVTGMIGTSTGGDNIEPIQGILDAIGSVECIHIIIIAECQKSLLDLAWYSEEIFYLLLASTLHRPREVFIKLVYQCGEDFNPRCMSGRASWLLECGIHCLRAENVRFSSTVDRIFSQQKKRKLQQAITTKDEHKKMVVIESALSRLSNFGVDDICPEWQLVADKVVHLARCSGSCARGIWKGSRSSAAVLLAYIDGNVTMHKEKRDRGIVVGTTIIVATFVVLVAIVITGCLKGPNSSGDNWNVAGGITGLSYWLICTIGWLGHNL